MKKVIVTVLCCCILKTAFTQSEQTLNKVTIAPPTAAALIKYTDVPVNYHTGIPQTGLPFYTLKEGTLEVPISLSYHAGGIKLDEQASWVGLGFSLNAGGVITRTVVGTPDENGTAEYGKNTSSHLSNSGYNNYYFQFDGYSPLSTQDLGYFNHIMNGVQDGEPDLFFFNFNGYSGKFYFNDDGRAVLVPEGDFKIDYTFTSGSQSIQKFIITTPDGTKYHFGVTDATNDVDPIEKTHNYYTGEDNLFYTGTNNTIASWYLNKIVSADDQFTITLNYTAEQYSYKSVISKTSKSDTYEGTAPNLAKFYGHWVQAVRLSSIIGSNVSVFFDPGNSRDDLSDQSSAANMNDVTNTNSKTLGAIRIQNTLGDCKKFSFSYSYFTSTTEGLPAGVSGTSTTDLKRLKLNQVNESKCDGTNSLPPYTFDYFTETLPRRLSFAKDHWGYVNGKTTNDRLIPTFYEKIGSFPVFREVTGGDREPAWPAMRAGSLKKITYPTGGFTEFDFEANTTWLNYQKYDKVFSFSMSAGFDGSSNPVTQSRTFNGAAYTVKLTNLPGGESATFNGAGIYVGASAGQTSSNQAMVTAGTYNVTLQKLNPPSGYGAIADVYEWVASTVQENKMVGGMRIKTITHNDGTASSPTIITSYDYNLADGKSSGHLYSRPTYVQIVRNDFLRDAGMYTTDPNAVYYCSPYGYDVCSGDPYIVSGNSIRPMQTTQGNHLGYNEVKVSQTNNGYKIYRYYGSGIWDNNYNDVANRVVELGLPQSNSLPNYPAAPPKTDFMRGELKYEGAFNQSGQLLSESNYYPEYTENPLKTPALFTGSGTFFAGLPTFYEVTTSKKTKQTVLSRVFQSPGVYIESTTDNFFNSAQHTQLTKKTETNSKGEAIEINYKYAADYKPDPCLTIADGLAVYNADCNACQTTYINDRNAVGHNNGYWKYWDYQKKLKCLSNARKTFFAARKNYFNPSISGSFANCLANAKTNASVDLKPLFELQDRFMNPPVEVYSKKNTNLTGATFSKYIYGTAPANMVYLNAIQTISLTTPSATFANSYISGNNLSKDSRYADEASVIINNGNVSQATAKDGVITSYIWGYNNTLPIVKAVNVDYATLLNAYNAVSGNLSLIRSQPSLANALLNTYEYRAGVGIIKETDARGRNINYEYDALNRLTIIRDHDNNVIKKICYNYLGQADACSGAVFSNTAQSGNFTRNNCGAGYTGSTVTYTVAAGIYTSTVSQADADQQAVNDVNANGQNYANANGTCIQLITVNGYNQKASTYTVKFTNNATGTQYTFYLNPNTYSLYTLGTVPSGTYTVQFSPAGSPVWATHNINGFTQYAQYGATFYNISVTATSTATMY